MPGKNEVLYCGDGTLETGGRYLGAVMDRSGIGFDYVGTAAPFPAEFLERDYRLVILSDYPARNFPPGALTEMAGKIERGASLLMVGGWASFHGATGGYQASDLAPVLPVECLSEDDRLNGFQGLVPEIAAPHPVLDGLPWDEPPTVCGCNRVKARPGAEVILTLRRLRLKQGDLSLEADTLPLLVLGHYGRGKTGAFTVDFAPHWAGGLLDWGRVRIAARTAAGGNIEVGNHYVVFIRNILGYFLNESRCVLA